MRLLAVGDSLTWSPRGHIPMVAARLGAELEVRAATGATTRQVIPLVAGAEPADVAVVGVGTNDVLNAWRGPRELGAALTDLLDALPPCDSLVLMTLPRRLGSRPWPLPWSPGKPRRVDEANAVVREVASARGATVVDLVNLYRLGRVTRDRVHPTAAGVQETGRRLAAVLVRDAARV